MDTVTYHTESTLTQVRDLVPYFNISWMRGEAIGGVMVTSSLKQMSMLVVVNLCDSQDLVRGRRHNKTQFLYSRYLHPRKLSDPVVSDGRLWSTSSLAGRLTTFSTLLHSRLTSLVACLFLLPATCLGMSWGAMGLNPSSTWPYYTTCRPALFRHLLYQKDVARASLHWDRHG